MSRLRDMLLELEQQLIAARDHEATMRQGAVDSATWSRPQDREWIVEAAAEARQHRQQAEARLQQGRAIVAEAAARDFAKSIAEYGYPHSGAIETYGAVIVDEGTDVETWEIAPGWRVELHAAGVRVVAPGGQSREMAR